MDCRMNTERERVMFIYDRDGYDEAIEWAKRTYKIYRSCVLNKRHFASKVMYRRRFIESYIDLKKIAFSK